ncbi:MAG: hypothetical protein INQ03_05805 [Candidatus Heimdallarchaeota archaeon]|nr:hypothetical protein [Candidatus Heimdallarchaeota archaeon]
MSSSNVVKKKKKWGKIYSYTPVKRSKILTEEMAAEIEKDLKKPNVTTAIQFAQKHNVTVGLAKSILNEAVKDGKLTLVHSTSKTKIYR